MSRDQSAERSHNIKTGNSSFEWMGQFIYLGTTLRNQKYRVKQEERTKLREGVPYVKLYRKNPKHLYPKLNGLGNHVN